MAASQTRAGEAEAARYRQAANDALQQLDFCIGYFAGVNKGKIADRLARNRSFIRRGLLGLEEEPSPTSDD